MTQLSPNDILGTLGPTLSFHDIVRSENLDQIPVRYFDSFDAIFSALKDDHIQAALVATKNSIHGNVARNTHMITESGWTVLKNFELPITLHLAAKIPMKVTDIKKIFAHPVAWNECQSLLKGTEAGHLLSSSNSQALIDLKNSSVAQVAAISGREAIERSGMKLIYENIHDREPNITTFALVKKVG